MTAPSGMAGSPPPTPPGGSEISSDDSKSNVDKLATPGPVIPAALTATGIGATPVPGHSPRVLASAVLRPVLYISAVSLASNKPGTTCYLLIMVIPGGMSTINASVSSASVAATKVDEGDSISSPRSPSTLVPVTHIPVASRGAFKSGCRPPKIPGYDEGVEPIPAPVVSPAVLHSVSPTETELTAGVPPVGAVTI